MLEDINFDTRDEFNRKPFAEHLINLIKSDNDLFPLAINGDWGTGKTEFCNKSVKLINRKYSDRLIAGYLNAFAEDPYDDPLASIISILYTTFITDEFRPESIKTITKIILATSAQSAIETISPTLANVTKNIPKIAQKLNKESIQSKFEHRANINNYLKELTSLISRIAGNKQFILFIDELDRCRPDFALHLLEITKHVFDTPHLKIIFILNKTQFIEAIKIRYSNNEDIARKYLEKFFKFQIKIPEFVRNNVTNTSIFASSKYFEILLSQTGVINNELFAGKNQAHTQSIVRLWDSLIEHHKISLRDVEKLIRYLQMYLTFYPVQPGVYLGTKLIISYAIFEYTLNLEIYQNYLLKKNAFITRGDLLTSIDKSTSTIPPRYTMFLLLFSDDFRQINHLYDGWGMHDLSKRRLELISIFKNLQDLVDS